MAGRTPLKLLLASAIMAGLFLSLASSAPLDWRYASYHTTIHDGIYFYCVAGNYPGYYACTQIEPLKVLYE